jgi:WD40 repeat protein
LILPPLFTARAADADAGRPLPAGAKLRLGDDRLTSRGAPAAVLLPPNYDTFLFPTNAATLRRFNATTGESLDGTKGGGGYGDPTAVSGDGKRAVVIPGSHDLTVRDTATGKALLVLKTPDGFNEMLNTAAGPRVALSADGKVAAHGVWRSADASGAVVVWDVDKGAVVAQFDGLQHHGAIPVLSADGKLLATRGQSTTGSGRPDDTTGRLIQVWDVGTKKELFRATVSPGGYQISACAFSADGTLLAAGCADGPVDLWDLKTGRRRATLLGRTGQGLCVAFSPDGQTVAAAATDGTVERWATADGKRLGLTEPPVEPPKLKVTGLAFADNTRVVAWGAVGSVAVAWDAPSGKLFRPLGTQTDTIASVAFADGGKRVVTSAADGRVLTWDAATGKPVGALALRLNRPNGGFPTRPVVTLSPDGTRGVSGDSPAAVFDLSTGKELFAIPRGEVGTQTTTHLSADGTTAVTLSYSFHGPKTGTATVWDLGTRTKVREVEVASEQYMDAALSPSGERLVVARYTRGAHVDQQVLVVTGFEVKTGKKLAEVEDHRAYAAVAVTVASETTALVASGGGRLRLFDYETGRGGDEIDAATGGTQVGTIVFSPDRKLFAFGVVTDESEVYGVRVCSWPSVKTLRTFAGHRGPVTALRFAPDGKTLASGSSDTTVLLWDLTALDTPK